MRMFKRLVSVVKMATDLECITEEQRSVMFFLCVQKASMQRIFVKKFFLSTLKSFCRVKRFSHGGKRFDDDKKVETEVAEVAETTVKQDFHVASFHALVKRWAKCVNVSGGYVEK
jgi:hypothetical protein